MHLGCKAVEKEDRTTAVRLLRVLAASCANIACGANHRRRGEPPRLPVAIVALLNRASRRTGRCRYGRADWSMKAVSSWTAYLVDRPTVSDNAYLFCTPADCLYQRTCRLVLSHGMGYSVDCRLCHIPNPQPSPPSHAISMGRSGGLWRGHGGPWVKVAPTEAGKVVNSGLWMRSERRNQGICCSIGCCQLSESGKSVAWNLHVSQGFLFSALSSAGKFQNSSRVLSCSFLRAPRFHDMMTSSS